MAPITNYNEIQQNEVDALRSIFMSDFIEKEAKTGPWNVGRKPCKGPKTFLFDCYPFYCGGFFLVDLLGFSRFHNRFYNSIYKLNAT